MRFKTIVCLLLMTSLNVADKDALAVRHHLSASAAGSSNATRAFVDRGLQVMATYLKQLRKGRKADLCRLYSKLNVNRQIIDNANRLPCAFPFEVKVQECILCVLREIHAQCATGRAPKRTKESFPSAAEAIDVVCYEREYVSSLVRRCDDRLTFDLSQKTKNKLHLIQEAINCKAALVSSSCGEATGLFTFYVSVAQTTITRSTARILSSDLRLSTGFLPSNYSGFRYDANCPSYFVADVSLCYADYLDGNLLSFEQENDLIATDGASLNNSCRSFRKYKLCLRPIKKACPRGLELLFDYENHLRKYVLKMEFICSPNNLNVYAKHVMCYRKALEQHNVTLRCHDLWRDLVPLLNAVTAFEFYCVNASATRVVQRQLDLLRECYEAVYESDCGSEGGHLLGRFIRLAFTDPHYLGYRYYPNCHLHGFRGSVIAGRVFPARQEVTDAELPHQSIDEVWQRKNKPLQVVNAINGGATCRLAMSRLDFVWSASVVLLALQTVSMYVRSYLQ